MPELPEVAALAGFLREHLVGSRIVGIELEEYGALKTRDRSLDELAGRTVSGIRRFGKHVAIDTDGPSLVVGFGRAGWMAWPDADAADGAAPVIARMALESGAVLQITDAGAWLSLTLSVADDAGALPALAKLGPDPASADYATEDLDRVLVGRRKQLKALLQEQESLAGIGNAYSDEILHAARLWPLTHAADLDAGQRASLYEAMRGELAAAFRAREGVPIDQLKARKVAAMRVHGRRGAPCPVCGNTVADLPGSKGAAQYCPTCQPEP
ncbi:MAG: Fpg/Nei family DNA glycosylase [Microbacterium sp.]|uniref:DNA-formamidopyrimidine glycosylase family protein n=1 Tax=Microbacterium sp. TaxID=51671 RepID=UPI001AC31524|nr:DNA-formamidopyrimidine glycosylase family protein [Microbacterium sp.]MBN9176497.1 Fpg/Nei family DNA glycosylase [Microbacterium sp.]